MPANSTAEPAENEKKTTRFVRWRRGRPFIPGLLMILAGIVIITPAYLSVRISDLLVMISTISGVSTFVIGALLIMFGLGAWFRPATATYLGVFGIIIAVVALPTSNFGGFLLGSILGIVGGAFTLAWEPTADATPDSDAADAGSGTDEGETAESTESAVGAGDADKNPYATFPASEGAASIGAADTADSVNAEGNAEGVAEDTASTADGDAVEQPKSPGPKAPYHTPKAGAALLVAGLAASVYLYGAGDIVEAQQQPTQYALQGTPGIVKADKVTFLGNVRVALVPVETESGTVNALRLTGDKLIADNLSVEVPGSPANGLLTTGPGAISQVIDGPVEVQAVGLKTIPALADISTIPVAIDLSGDLGSVLRQLQLPEVGVPDPIMQNVSLRNTTLDLISLKGHILDVPTVRLRPS